jgi:PTS system sucrose-specific IIC component
MQSGIRAIAVMLTSSALGGMILSLSIKANSYGLAVLLSPLMYIYDSYQFVSYIIVGIAVFIFAFIAATLFVNTNNPVAKK